MKKIITIKISNYLLSLINQNKNVSYLFSEILSNYITEYNLSSTSIIDIKLLFSNNYLYYMVSIYNNNNISTYYGKILTNEININISSKL